MINLLKFISNKNIYKRNLKNSLQTIFGLWRKTFYVSFITFLSSIIYCFSSAFTCPCLLTFNYHITSIFKNLLPKKRYFLSSIIVSPLHLPVLACWLLNITPIFKNLLHQINNPHVFLNEQDHSLLYKFCYMVELWTLFFFYHPYLTTL